MMIGIFNLNPEKLYKKGYQHAREKIGIFL
jgi:hypothetical protein